MRWEDLLFLHWPMAAAALRPHLPAGLELETFDGTPWLGAVPFRMARTRFRWLPPIPSTHTFAELNLRTYVRAGGRAGVWFFSLDAASRLAVEVARIGYSLPYFAARTACKRDGERVHFRSERTDRRGPPARFCADWRVAGPFAPARPGTFEHFLVERYCLFASRRGRLVCGEIAHAPWQLAAADVRIETNEVTRLLGCGLVGAPVSVLAAAPLDVAAWSPIAIA